MSEEGRVISVEDGRAHVRIDEPRDGGAGCAACGMRRHCAGGAAGERVLGIEAPPGIAPGDEVTVEIDLPSPALAALLLFIVPLAAAVGAGAAVYGLTSSGALGLVAGLAGMALAYVLVFLAGPKGSGNVEITTTSGPGPDE
jgi:positive regulator of sigma E activity